MPDTLIDQKEYEVTILDILEEQVQGNIDHPLDYLNDRVKFFKGCVTDYKKLENIVMENGIIFHLAAIFGIA